MSTGLKEGPDAWLIRKGGYFYRPKRCGYTTVKAEAGRYTEAEAKREASVEPWHMAAILADEVPDPPHVVDKRDVEIARLSAEVERLKGERDAAVMEVSRQAAARGRAEGALATSETAGVVEGWRASAEAAEAEAASLTGLYRQAIQLADAHRRRAEAAEARVAELTTERDKARRYCSVSAYDMAGIAETLKANPDAFPRTAHDLMETSEFMRLAGEGREDGTVYDDELSKEKAHVKVLEEALHFYSEFMDHGEIARAALSHTKEDG